MGILWTILGLLMIPISIMMCYQESKQKPMPFWLALLLCFVITPIGVYLIFLFLPKRNPIGCSYCGNDANESEYCGLCGKNISGELHPYKKAQ